MQKSNPTVIIAINRYTTTGNRASPVNRAHVKRPVKLLTLSWHQYHREAYQTILLASLGFDRAHRLVVLLLFVSSIHSVTICTPKTKDFLRPRTPQYKLSTPLF